MMESKKNKILVADDEKEIRDILSLLLKGEGYEVITAENGLEAVELADEDVDMYILDVNMPLMSGFLAGDEIRKRRYYAPIIFLTAYSGESDKVMGYSVGADDYIAKPFSNMDLLLRIKALLRRSQHYAIKNQEHSKQEPEQKETKLILKDLIIDLESQSVMRGEQVIVLTYTEFKILELFVTNRKRIYSLDHIYQTIWGDEAVGDSTIMVHIKNIRKKIGDNSRNPQYIKTAWGKGYYVD